MESIGDAGRWIAENEALLSGLVSLIVLVGLVLSPLGKGVRRLLAGGPAEPDPGDPAPAATPKPAEPGEPLLAVLAFDNLSSDEEMRFFSDGISEEILQRLSRGAKLKVIGRTSSFQLRGWPTCAPGGTCIGPSRSGARSPGGWARRRSAPSRSTRRTPRRWGADSSPRLPSEALPRATKPWNACARRRARIRSAAT